LSRTVASRNANLFAQHSPDNKQGFNQRDEIGKILDHLVLGRPHNPDLETEVAQGGPQVILNSNGFRLQKLAVGQQHAQLLTPECLHMHRAIKPDPHHLGIPRGIVAIGLVDLRLQHRAHVPGLNTDHRASRLRRAH
jgi:hypothetical protein